LRELGDSEHFPAQIFGGDKWPPSFSEMGIELHKMLRGHTAVIDASEFVSTVLFRFGTAVSQVSKIGQISHYLTPLLQHVFDLD